jgi:hypothetical protein
MQRQAQDILARWDATVAGSGLKPAYAPTYGVEMVHDSAQILNGRPLEFNAQVPATVPPTVLTWPDGTSRSAYGLTAKQAFDELVKYTNPPVCGQCPAAHVTGAGLITRSLPAVGGPVTAPAWELTFAEFPDHAIVAAVDPDQVLLPVLTTADTVNKPAGITPDKAWTDTEGRRLVVEFIGAPNAATGPCGVDYTVELVYSDLAVVVVIHSHRYHPPSGQPDRPIVCLMSGGDRQVAVDLRMPLDGRVLLDGVWGHRIPLIRSIQ